MSAPLPLADFWSGLRISQAEPVLPEVAEVSRTAGGEVTVSSLGASLWRCAISVVAERVDEGRALQALLRKAKRTGTSFLVTPVEGAVPLRDPLGTIAGAAVSVGSISTDRLSLALAGLPPSYTMSVGDFVSIDVGGIPHLHQLAAGGAADAAGNTPLLELAPAIRANVTAGMAVTLVNPTFKAIIDPATVREGRFARAHLSGVQFTLLQTLR